MRNILEYPITLEEKIEVLETLRADILGKKRMGDMRPAVLRAVIEDINPKPAPPQRELPLEPEPDAGDIIAGPRIPLVYGSAATKVRISTREWSQVERGRVKWIGIDDFSNPDSLLGKKVRLASGAFGEVIPAEERDDAFAVKLDHGGGVVGCWHTDQVQVVEDRRNLSLFERAIAGHKAAQLLERHDDAVQAVIEQARQYRLEMKGRINGLGGTLRASLLKEFGWTEDDLKEVQ